MRGKQERTQLYHGARMMASIITGTMLLLLVGCAGSDKSYREKHEVRQLTVVFLDEPSLHKEWESRTGRQPVRLLHQMNDTAPSVKTLRGFYDYGSNTIYCPKWDFEVCGHELHHAVLGQFHPQH